MIVIVFEIVRPLQSMQKIVIKVSCLRSFKRRIEFPLGILFVMHIGIADELRRKREALSWMTFDQSLSDSLFGTRIGKSCIKVSTASL